MNPWRGLGKLPREVWLLSGAVLINRTGTMARPFLVLYLTRALGYTAAQAALALTIFGVASLLAAPFSGRLSDKIRPLRVMKLSLVLTGLVMLLFPMIRSLPLIYGATFLWAVVSEAFRPASLALIADLVPPIQRKAAFALMRLAINLGMSIGPAAGGYLLLISYPIIFWVDGLTTLAAGLLLIVIPWHATGRTKAEPSAPANGDSAIAPSPLHNRRLLYFLLAIMPAVVVFFQLESSMPLFMVRDLHLAEHVYGILFTVNTLLIVMTEVPLNLAMTKWPHHHVLPLGALLIAAGFGAMSFASGFWSVAFTVVIWTCGEMILFPGMAAYMADIAPSARRGEYMGLFQMAMSLSFAIGPWLGTAILDRAGASMLWPATFVAGLFSAAMLWRVQARSV
jgi:predicted MFS family arabinose efflux permease